MADPGQFRYCRCISFRKLIVLPRSNIPSIAEQIPTYWNICERVSEILQKRSHSCLTPIG